MKGATAILKSQGEILDGIGSWSGKKVRPVHNDDGRAGKARALKTMSLSGDTVQLGHGVTRALILSSSARLMR